MHKDCYIAGVSSNEVVEVIGPFTESEAMQQGSNMMGFDHVLVYIRPTPFAVFKCKAAPIAKKRAGKKAAKKKTAK